MKVVPEGCLETCIIVKVLLCIEAICCIAETVTNFYIVLGSS